MTPNEYLYEQAKKLDATLGKQFLFAEVGTNGGTSAIWTMRALKENNSARWFFTIDPYGDKPYKAGQDTMGTNMGYNDALYRKTMRTLAQYAEMASLNHVHFKMTSLDFMRTYPDIEFWHEGQMTKDARYGFVYLDGDHWWEPVAQEFSWFHARLAPGGKIAIDDYNLLGGESAVRQRLEANYPGEWIFQHTEDDHYRVWHTKP